MDYKIALIDKKTDDVAKTFIFKDASLMNAIFNIVKEVNKSEEVDFCEFFEKYEYQVFDAKTNKLLHTDFEYKFAKGEKILIKEPFFDEEQDWYVGVSCYGIPYGIENAYGKVATVTGRYIEADASGQKYKYYFVEGDFDELPCAIEEVFLRKVVAI